MRPRLKLPVTPGVAGLRFRTYAGDADLPAMAEVANAANAANGDTEFVSAGSLGVWVANLSHIDPHEDVVLAFVHDRLVAWSFIEWADTSDGERHYRCFGDVHPAVAASRHRHGHAREERRTPP